MGPTTRNIPNLLRNLRLAWRTISAVDPDVILSTGAALAVPFFVVGRLRRRRLVYVESLTRVNELALSGRLVYPLADAFFVQWREAVRPTQGDLRRERRVIFATCGSSHLPFERLMQALAVLPADELVVQHGPAEPPPAARAVPFLPYSEVVSLIEEADVVDQPRRGREHHLRYPRGSHADRIPAVQAARRDGRRSSGRVRHRPEPARDGSA